MLLVAIKLYKEHGKKKKKCISAVQMWQEFASNRKKQPAQGLFFYRDYNEILQNKIRAWWIRTWWTVCIARFAESQISNLTSLWEYMLICEYVGKEGVFILFRFKDISCHAFVSKLSVKATSQTLQRHVVRYQVPTVCGLTPDLDG